MLSSVYLWEITVAWRNCLRRPGFLLLASLTLALGIGACSTTFALIDNFVLSPPPYADPAHLAMLGPVDASGITTMTPMQYQQLPGLPGYSGFGAASIPKLWNVSGTGGPVLVPGRPADRGFLIVLGIRMAQGRNFTEDEDRPNGPSVAIVSHRLWLNQLGGSAGIVGHTIDLDGKPATVVGVLPPRFQFVEPVDVLVPLGLSQPSRDRGNHLWVVARLNRGVRLAQASADLSTRLYSRAAEIQLNPSDHIVFSATSLSRDLSATAAPVALMFFAFSAILLALVAANLSNLLLLRAVVRGRDIALRSALGADKVRLSLPSLAEGLLVGVLGILGGLVMASFGLSWINGYIPLNWMNSLQGAHLGLRVYVFATLLALAIPALSSLLAVRRARVRNITQELGSGSHAGWSRGSRLVGRALLIAQVCLASTLLIVALALSGSIARLSKVDLGLNPGAVLTFTVNPLPARYPDAAAWQSFMQHLMPRLHEIPGTGQVAASTNLPIGLPFSVPLKLPDGNTRYVQYRPVTPGFFAVFGISQIAGRDFTEQDTQTSERVAIVNLAFAQRYFKDQIQGQSIEPDLKLADRFRVIGVVGNVHQSGPQLPVEPTVYIPLMQVSDSLMQSIRHFMAMHFYLKMKGHPGLAVPGVRAAVQEIAPDQAISDLSQFDEVVARLTAPQRLDLKLMGILSLLAFMVANVGLYSVASVTIASRTRDFGIQAALGAGPPRLVAQILTDVLRQILAGLILGTAAGFIVSRYLRNTIAGLDPVGLSDVLLTGALLALIGVFVCLRPAVRAGRVNPFEALKEQ
ncbi:MAG TPA: ABC transporter permease [Candidatus Angelobacter sp.]|nr:ABC transporter permease [Candidatus Angelobacter sp.]